MPVQPPDQPAPQSTGAPPEAESGEAAKQRAAVLPYEDLYELLVSSVVDYAIFALDEEGRVMTWNAGAERMKGYRASEIVGTHFSLFYPDEDVARGKPAQDLLLAAEQGRVETEGWRERKDGTRFWANVILTALRHPDTRGLIGYSKVTRDLTERRVAEEALRQSESRHRLFMESVKDYALYMMDPRGHIISWNAGAQRLKGYRAKDVVGEHFRKFYTAKDRETDLPGRELRIALSEGRFEGEGWRIRADGTQFWANVIITPIIDSTGRHVGFAKVTRDLTERRRMEEDLRRRVEARTNALTLLNRELEAFNYTVSHDLRAPLRGIAYMVDAALEDLGDPERVREHLARIQRDAKRANRLVEDLLRFAQVSNATDMQHSHVDVGAIAREIAEQHQESETDRVVRFSAPESVTTWGDAGLIRVILENLLSNAWKYTRGKAEAHVELGVSTTEGQDGQPQKVFYVRDDGVGFDDALAERLFTPFSRLHSPKEFEGTGIGLATVKRIVERHNGRVWAESRPGEGATFYFTLPHERPAPEGAE